MIESLVVKNEGSYNSDGVALTALKPINFIYGANGSGKTTLSKVMAAPEEYSDCSVNWRTDNALKTLVYNRDFIEQSFTTDKALKGIFTLGEGDADTVDQIEIAEEEKKDVVARLAGKRRVLQGEDGNGGKLAELNALEDEFSEQCWGLKKKYEGEFKAAFKGSVKEKKIFKERFAQEAQNNETDLLTLSKLQEQAQTIYADDPIKEDIITPIPFVDLLGLEQSSVLAKKIIGSSDVDIAAMIERLGNNDWVRQGRVFYEQNDGHCPFCQQETPQKLAQDLESFFDETYLADLDAIKELATNYDAFSTNVTDRLDDILIAEYRFLDKEKLRGHKEILDARITANKLQIERKGNEASSIVELNTLQEVVDEVNATITAANDKATAHNTTIDNLTKEKRDLTTKIWRFLVEEGNSLYQAYHQRKEALESTISTIQNDVRELEQHEREYSTRIKALEAQISSIQPTIDAINGLLNQFGFTSFSLDESEKKGFYEIVRPNGVDARSTLSEGEKTFITFLYFYHLLKGSETQSGMTEDRVVVFDDPISSLDSDILFIVSNLVKTIFADISSGAGQIKQAFVLTHNIYFHKEVSYKRSSGSFWIIRKKENHSEIEFHQHNPIQNSYELLWQEIQRDDYSVLTIRNTLRRILEHYFKILGNTDFEDIINKFDGEDKVMCSSLFSWVHDGSHVTDEDMYIACTPETAAKYLTVFKDIFDKSGHISHYDMMFGNVVEFSTQEAAA